MLPVLSFVPTPRISPHSALSVFSGERRNVVGKTDITTKKYIADHSHYRN